GFLIAVSHDVKNHLGVDLVPVRQRMMKTKNPDNRELWDGGHRNGMKINDLIQERMTFDEKEERTGMDELITSQLDLKAFVERCRDEWKQVDMYKHIEWRLVADTEGLLIQTDVSKLESMLNNLLANACKYSKPEGAVVELYLDENETGIVITIRDNGIGIKKKDLP